ncbi:hypothetical protein GLA29479_4037 [Lysobacter antibioticus]|nr:hypothetical protein GLA29479_4037 [Lysobacter antibioticus]
MKSLAQFRSCDAIVDPEGAAQDVRRFSIGQGCPIEKSRR